MTNFLVPRIPGAAWITVTAPGPAVLADQAPAANRHPKVVMAMIGAAAAARIARDRRTYERLIVFAIVLAAAAGMARASQARSQARMAAWLKRL